MRTAVSSVIVIVIGFVFLWPGFLLSAVAMPAMRQGPCSQGVADSNPGFLWLNGALSICAEHVLVRGLGWMLLGLGLTAVVLLWFGPLRSWRSSE